MTPAEINIAIAEACGWSEIRKSKSLVGMLFGNHPDENLGRTQVPNYHGDLNACAEMRASIPSDDVKSRASYQNHLRAVVGRWMPKNSAGAAIVSDYDCMNANPEEHCEAFLRMKGVLK